MIPFLNHTPGSPISQRGRTGPGAAGRPLAFRAKFSIRPVTDQAAGFKQTNSTPEVLKAAHENYIKKGTLPPTLVPKNAKPRVMQDRTNKNISRGWRKPLDGRR